MSWIVMLILFGKHQETHDSHDSTTLTFGCWVFLVLGHFEDFAPDSDSSQDVIFVGLPKIWETHGDPPRDTLEKPWVSSLIQWFGR